MNRKATKKGCIQKLLLLKDTSNKVIWRDKARVSASSRKVVKDEIWLDKLGIPYQTLNSAIKRNKNGANPETLDRICQKINQNHLHEIKRKLSVEDFYDDVSMSDFGAIFGLSKDTIKRILDDYHFSTGPLLPLFYSNSKLEADKIFKKIEGFYYLYRYGLTLESYKKIHKIGIHIRRVLKTAQGYVIRCKMLVVDETEVEPYSEEYDGYIYNANHIYSFVFTPRNSVEWCTLSVVDNQHQVGKKLPYEGLYQSTMDNEAGTATQLQFRRALIEFESKDREQINQLFAACCTYDSKKQGGEKKEQYRQYQKKLNKCYNTVSDADVFPSEYINRRFSFSGLIDSFKTN